MNTSANASPGRAIPALFVSHGAPLFAIDVGETGPALGQWGRDLRAQFSALRGVVILSPHWMAREALVTTGAQPATLHDFGGFPSELYALQYPAPGAPALAQAVLALLQAAGGAAQGDALRPFDHGAWVPLMHLFPKADVPVVQVALPAGFGPAQVFAMGQALRSLRAQGVLVIGSGSMTHNLYEFRHAHTAAADYAVEFTHWIRQAVTGNAVDQLVDYRRRAPHAERAHPTEEHYLPLLVAMGAAGPLGQFTQAMGWGLLSFTFTGLVIGSVVFSMPFAVQPLQHAFESMGRRPMEVAATLRASPLDAFFTVALPQARTGLLTAAILSFAHTVGEFGVVLMIGGNIPGKTRVVSTQIYGHVEAMEYAQAHWLAGGMVLFSFVVLLCLALLKNRGSRVLP